VRWDTDVPAVASRPGSQRPSGELSGVVVRWVRRRAFVQV